MSNYRMDAPQSVTDLNLSLARIDNETTAAINSVIENLARSAGVLRVTADFIAEMTPDSAGTVSKVPDRYRVQVAAMRDQADALRKTFHEMRKAAELMVRLAEEAQTKTRFGRARSQMAGRRSI